MRETAGAGGDEGDLVVDPVCGVAIERTGDTRTTEHDGMTYHFCSESCLEHFEADPAGDLAVPQPHLITEGGLLTQRVPYGPDAGRFEVRVADADDISVGDGSRFTKALTHRDVRKFAEASGDTNALHLSEEFAARTRFGRRIVHGTLVSGLVSAALAALPGLTIYLAQKLEYRRPVDIGETVTAICDIVEELEDDRYRLTTRVENDAGKIAVHGTATVLIDPLPGLE